jgi:thiol:disulfide interchange protein DsbC
MLRTLVLCVLCLAGAALADEAAIRKALEPKVGSARIEGIAPAPLAGLWEVRLRSAEGLQIVYTDAAGTHVILGNLVELRSNRNLTEERMRKLTAIDFASLPLDQAVKIQRGNGKRVMAMFSDPYCPACRKFEAQLGQIDNMTVYVFMYPVIRPENADHSRAVWCSPDRAKAWLELAASPRPKVPSAGANCAGNVVEKTLELGRKLGVNSTPTLFLANGERFTGGLAAPDLREALDQAAR